jgi:lysozyme family protein
MNSNFAKSFSLMLQSEGGFSDNPADTGNHLPDGRAGCTNLGVTQTAWEEYVGHPVSTADMKALTPATVMDFYKRRYWDMVKGDALPNALDYLVFDMAVNSGPGRAIKLLQASVGATQDGALGPLTMQAISTWSARQLIDKYSAAKADFYKSLRNPTFEKGWLNRVEHTKANALEMLSTN